MSQTAMKRAHEMMRLPVKDLPPLAVRYAQYFVEQYGFSGDILLTAWAHYAQCVEGLACEDVHYQADDQARVWFALHRSMSNGTT